MASNVDNQFAAYNQRNKVTSNGDNVASATNQVSKQAIFKTQNPQGTRNNYDQSRYADGRWRIIRQNGETDTDGYHWE